MGQIPAEISRGEYVEWLRIRVHELEAPSSVRNRAALAAFALTQTHHHAIVLLCEHGLFGSAFSLLRSCFESYVRGQWLLNCATDAQLKDFLAGGDPPKLTALISAVEQVPGFEENVLSKIKLQFWSSLCAYTHSGGLHLQRWQTDDAVEPNYASDEIEEVLSFAETLGSIATISILGITDQAVLANDVLEAYQGRSDAT